MVVENPSGSKPMSPTIEPSSAGGFLRNGMDADRSAAIIGAGARTGAVAGMSEIEAEAKDSILRGGKG